MTTQSLPEEGAHDQARGKGPTHTCPATTTLQASARCMPCLYCRCSPSKVKCFIDCSQHWTMQRYTNMPANRLNLSSRWQGGPVSSTGISTYVCSTGTPLTTTHDSQSITMRDVAVKAFTPGQGLPFLWLVTGEFTSGCLRQLHPRMRSSNNSSDTLEQLIKPSFARSHQ